ncbi:oxaloacetate tautomerase FAHD2A, mitochondrial-like [Tubulanus polymorphus]|uniref:oxaloacetate tautomerase FAHD2A, mitochondrial-like n=1 Tax=Tubulanus polymorphus TaxID=672921 RepID=UPI003DA4434C
MCCVISSMSKLLLLSRVISLKLIKPSTFSCNFVVRSCRSLHRHRHSKMRFVQFTPNTSDKKSTIKLGVQLENGEIVDLNDADSAIPNSMVEFLQEGDGNVVKKVKRIVAERKCTLKPEEVNLTSPITKPDKVLCIGMNYHDHCSEQNLPVPTEPVIFSKFASSIVGPNDDVVHPKVTQELDWEVELTIVIGKGGKDIKETDAMDHVFGYTIAHDVSARDWQMKRNGKQWLVGKTMDTFCPLGPAVVTKDSISDPHKIGLRCRVNGITKQDSNTNQLVFKTEKLVSFVSQFVTLTPGDIILTGTPPGVGVFRNPPEFLKKGDVVECEIDEIGKIVNKVV